jgi:hypothetical protein
MVIAEKKVRKHIHSYFVFRNYFLYLGKMNAWCSDCILVFRIEYNIKEKNLLPGGSPAELQ